MRRFYSIVVLLFLFSFNAFCQTQTIGDNNILCNCLDGGGIGDLLFNFRVVNGQYPRDKKEVLEFFLDAPIIDSGNSSMDRIIRYRDSLIIVELKDSNNTYAVSGDTCWFYQAQKNYMYRCVGGIEELMRQNSRESRFWAHSYCFDKDGKVIWPLKMTSPSLPASIRLKFAYVITMAPRNIGEEFPSVTWKMEPVLVPIRMTRLGDFSYSVSHLEGIPLFYQVYGHSLDANISNPISLEDALDSNYFATIKEYMSDFLCEHPEVEIMNLWELVMFNNAPIEHFSASSTE